MFKEISDKEEEYDDSSLFLFVRDLHDKTGMSYFRASSLLCKFLESIGYRTPAIDYIMQKMDTNDQDNRRRYSQSD